MPASHFFLMLDQEMILRANHYSELVEIQAISFAGSKYQEIMRAKYDRIRFSQVEEKPAPIPKPTFKAGSTEEKNAVISLVSSMRGGH